MPPPDRERDITAQADQPVAERDLARRLSRLPRSHPSAWSAPDRADTAPHRRADPEPHRMEWWHPAADAEPDESDWLPDEVADDPDDVAEHGADESADLLSAEDGDPDGLAGAPGEPGRPAAPARGGPQPETPTWPSELSRATAGNPYRPWFSAEGAGDPWFAVRKAE